MRYKSSGGLMLILPDKDGIVSETGDPVFDSKTHGDNNTIIGGVVVTPGTYCHPKDLIYIDGRPAKVSDLYQYTLPRALEDLAKAKDRIKPHHLKMQLDAIKKSLEEGDIFRNKKEEEKTEDELLNEIFESTSEEDSQVDEEASQTETKVERDGLMKSSNDQEIFPKMDVWIDTPNLGSILLRVDDVIFTYRNGMVVGIGLIINRRSGICWIPPAGADDISIRIEGRSFRLTGEFSGNFVWPSGEYDLIIMSVTEEGGNPMYKSGSDHPKKEEKNSKKENLVNYFDLLEKLPESKEAADHSQKQPQPVQAEK